MLYLGVLFFMVLQFLRPQDFMPLMYGSRIVLYTMMGLLPPWLLTLPGKKIFRTPQELFMLLFFASIVLSYWNYLKSHFYEPIGDFGKIFLLCMFVSHVLDTRRKILGSLWVIALMLVIVAALAGPDAGLPGQYASVGAFDNRNDFANAMAMMLPIAFALILRGNAFSRIIGIGLVVVATPQLVLSSSRGGQLAALAGVYSTIYLITNSKIGRRLMIVVGVIVLLAAFAMSERLSTATDYKNDPSAMGRVEMWARALELYKEHWLIGSGYGQFKEQPEVSRDTHSSYMRVFAELGTIGAFIYVGMFFFSLRDTLRLSAQGPHQTIRLCAMALTGILVASLVGGLFQTRAYHVFVLAQLMLVSSLRLVADREAAIQYQQLPDPSQPRNLWQASVGAGWCTPRLVTRQELYKIGTFTFLVWLLYKLFVMRSY